MTMTAEQLEELLGKVTKGECKFSSVNDGNEWFGCSVSIGDREVLWMEDDPETDEPIARLFALAPSLARRVLAAEKLVDAGCVMAGALKGNYIVPGSAAAWDAALTAYREASK